MFCHGFKTIWYTYSKEFVYLPDENCASTEWRRLQNFNDQAYALTPFMPQESSFITLPLFLKTTPFNKFIYSKLLILLKFRLFYCLFFQWVCFLLQRILRNFKLSMYNIMFGKNFVHTLFVCHNYWANHPTPYAAHSYETLKYL